MIDYVLKLGILRLIFWPFNIGDTLFPLACRLCVVWVRLGVTLVSQRYDRSVKIYLTFMTDKTMNK